VSRGLSGGRMLVTCRNSSARRSPKVSDPPSHLAPYKNIERLMLYIYPCTCVEIYLVESFVGEARGCHSGFHFELEVFECELCEKKYT
jgi:hypothetical protein